jgi:hypothetical protein
VIGKVLRGERAAGLIRYLYGPGRHEEHTDPHIVAGWRHPAELEPPLRPGGRRDFGRLNGLLQQTLAALGAGAPRRPVWHCVARAAPGDRMLSDEEWAQAAGEIMHRTGLAPYGQEDDAVRWVSIRHGDDHVHIVATLARQDGRRPRLSNDYYRVREACLAVEHRFGLRRTAPGDRTAASRPTRAEAEKTWRRGWLEAPRVTLKREVSTAAAAASGEQDFFARLQRAGVQVRMRYSTRNPGQVTGYSVALAHDTTRTGEAVWYGGGKLAADLTLPKLRQRWATTGPADAGTVSGGQLTPEERTTIWEHASRAAADATGQILSLAAAGDPAAAADAAWAAGDTLHAAAAALGSRMVHQAAAAYDRAARAPYGRIPRPSPDGRGLRRAARLLAAAAAFASHDRNLAQIVLIARLAALADAVAELRDVQHHAAQAAAARRAAERLHGVADGVAMRPVRERAQSLVTTELAGEAFPAVARLRRASSAAPSRGQPRRPSAQPQHGSSPRRRRGRAQ